MKVALTIRDDEGNIVDLTDVELTEADISDIIDRAANVVLSNTAEKSIVNDLLELKDILEITGVI